MTFPEWVRGQEALDVLRRFALTGDRFADSRWVEAHHVERESDLLVMRWSEAGFSWRFREVEADPERQHPPAVVLCGPASSRCAVQGHAVGPRHWLWVSVDMPERMAVLEPDEGLAWTRRILREVEAAHRLGWKKA